MDGSAVRAPVARSAAQQAQQAQHAAGVRQIREDRLTVAQQAGQGQGRAFEGSCARAGLQGAEFGTHATSSKQPLF